MNAVPDSVSFSWTLEQGRFLRQCVRDGNRPSQAVELLIAEKLFDETSDAATVLFMVHLAERFREGGSIYDDILEGAKS